LAAVLLISLGFLLAGIVAALVLLVRSGELRAAVLALCLGLLAVRQGIAAWQDGDERLGWDAGSVAELALLFASAAACAAVLGLWRSLAERDRAESHHWDSMEAVRLLSELAVRWDLGLEAKFEQLLQIGCARFDLEIGLISRIEGERFEVLALFAPEGFPVARGDVLATPELWCHRTLRSNRPLGIENVEEAAPLEDTTREPFGFATYLGVCVRVYGDVVGTVAFGSHTVRRERFAATEKDFAHLIAQWIGTELERQLASERRKLESTARPARSLRRDERTYGTTDVNMAIARAERSLRARVGSAAAITYDLGDGLDAVENLPLHAGAIVEILALAGLEAMPDGGEIHIHTANLPQRAADVASTDDGGAPPAGARHVTIAVTASGAAIRDDLVSEAFESSARPAIAPEFADLRTPLTVAELRRLLRRRGGDISLAIEPGRSAAFTVYLPCPGGHTTSAGAQAPPPA